MHGKNLKNEKQKASLLKKDFLSAQLGTLNEHRNCSISEVFTTIHLIIAKQERF